MTAGARALAAGLGIAALLSLAACRPTGYQAASFQSGVYGYSDKQVDRNEYAISVTGNRETSGQRVADIALLRAAHIAWERKRVRFRILIARSEALAARALTSVPVPIGGILVAVPMAETTAQEPHTILIIRLPDDDEPASPDDLDAEAVIAEIAPRLDAE